MKRTSLAAIDATKRNVARLVEDARYLLDYDRFPSAYALAVLAQEEAAKVYLLDLVRTGDVPWNSGVSRAMRDHTCKQLLVMILDYMGLELEAYIERISLRVPESPAHDRVPDSVLSAIEIFRHEKVGKFIDKYSPCWVDDPNYAPSALRIAEGKLDELKQDALYVRLGKNGQLGREPEQAITADLAREEVERADRLRWAVNRLDGGTPALWNHDEIRRVFRILFTDPDVLKRQGLLSDPPNE